jgi:hypothetical protein
LVEGVGLELDGQTLSLQTCLVNCMWVKLTIDADADPGLYASDLMVVAPYE